MDNTIYVAASRQMILRREMDVVANNIANADTTGFKVEQIISETDPENLPVQPGSGSRLVKFVIDKGLARDFGQGSLAQSGSPLDFAIEGDGFFQVNTPDGERYTRDGRFQLDNTGRLVTHDGHPVAGEGGAEITLDPTLGTPTVASDGTISQNGSVVGRLAAVNFPALAALEKDGDGLYRNTSNINPEPNAGGFIRQGMVESSNVQPVIEITRMIEISREYERIARLMDKAQELDRTAIERLGRVS